MNARQRRILSWYAWLIIFLTIFVPWSGSESGSIYKYAFIWNDDMRNMKILFGYLFAEYFTVTAVAGVLFLLAKDSGRTKHKKEFSIDDDTENLSKFNPEDYIEDNPEDDTEDNPDGDTSKE